MKKYLVSVSLVLILVVGCKGASDGVFKAVTKTIDPPPVPKKAIPIPVSQASGSISNFIKQAGKSAGKSHIKQQVDNRLPVSQKSLADVIFATALEELQKTGKVIVDRQINEMRREAFQAAIVAIAEYRQETGSQVEVVE